MRTTRTTVAAAAAAVALLGAAGPAVADSTTAPAPTATTSTPAPAAKAPTGDGARALCRRVPRIDARIDRALRRLGGPATVKGSVARLQKRVDNAAAKGDTAVETYLKDRLTFRKSLVPMLNQRSTDLDAVRTWCASRGQNTAGAGTAK
ncbi:hypothetical protein [Actinacidiphila acididurans]|uniref:Uncharacterized protein n=1 Tax=Actinacidiphila acididurans TaxID=2784346 RepID=A0ABS2U024_9ACTN|nr:hypothetical protein [Actinacidiphila acididurans]MBM9507563.1 hypothetical protein [Actinacidiphila acididurans]